MYAAYLGATVYHAKMECRVFLFNETSFGRRCREDTCYVQVFLIYFYWLVTYSCIQYLARVH